MHGGDTPPYAQLGPQCRRPGSDAGSGERGEKEDGQQRRGRACAERKRDGEEYAREDPRMRKGCAGEVRGWGGGSRGRRRQKRKTGKRIARKSSAEVLISGSELTRKYPPSLGSEASRLFEPRNGPGLGSDAGLAIGENSSDRWSPHALRKSLAHADSHSPSNARGNDINGTDHSRTNIEAV